MKFEIKEHFIMTEKEKMDLGLWYDANYDKELLDLRLDAEDLCYECFWKRIYNIKQKRIFFRKN